MPYSLTPALTSVTEGNTTITFTVTRTGSFPAETIYYSTLTGTATSAAGDYDGVINQALTFSAGQTSRTFTISVNEDTLVEGNEQFRVMIGATTSAGPSQALDISEITIVDDDTVATSYSMTPSSTSVTEGNTSVTFTITRSGGTPAETIYFSTLTGTATSGAGDYDGIINQAVTFSAGQTSRTVTVDINEDSLVEGNEQFRVMIGRNPGDGSAQALDTSTITIVDDDAPAGTSYALTPASTSVTEDNTNITFTITRSGATPAETIYISTLIGTASSATGDYDGLIDQALNFAAGQTSATFTIGVNEDTVAEASEQFRVMIAANPGEGSAQALDISEVTIIDDDGGGGGGSTFSITPASTSINENQGDITFTVTRSSSVGTETVYFSTVLNGGANTNDYVSIVDRAITFTAGQTSQQVVVDILPDSEVEPDQTFGVIIQQTPVPDPNVFLDRSIFTIVNDDGGGPAYLITPSAPTVTEANGATITFTVTRSATGSAETLYFSTVQTEGSQNNGDYVGIVNRAVQFAAGEGAKQVTVAIINDGELEANETFAVIAQTNGAQPASTFVARGTFTIVDNDAGATLPMVSLGTDVFYSESDGYAYIAISLSSPATQSVSVYYSTADGSARSSVDYTGVISQKVTFAPGEQHKQLKVHLKDDGSFEQGEHFFVSLHDPQGLVVSGDGLAIVNINDNDPNTSARADHSVLYLANLAAAAYKDWADLENSLDSQFTFLTDEDLSGVQANMSGGLFVNANAAGFAGVVGDTLYLVYRGTDMQGLVPNGDDFAHWFLKNAHYSLFSSFNAAVLEYVSDPSNGIKHVLVTGHSLGAAMAQKFMEAHAAESLFKAVVFANPGTDLGADTSDSRVSSFLIEGDAIGAPAYLEDVLGVQYFIRDVSEISTFDPFSLHDDDLYIAIAKFLGASNVNVGDAFLSYTGPLKLEIGLDISRSLNGEWIVRAPSVADLATSAVKQLLLSTSGDDSFDVQYGAIYSVAHLSARAVVDLIGLLGGNAGSNAGRQRQLTPAAAGDMAGFALGEGIGTDRLVGVQHVVTGAGDDEIYGDNNANTLAGGAGDDIVVGRGGDDVFIGAEGQDRYDGGDGTDTVVFDVARSITVDLSASANQARGDDIGTDQIASVENVVGGAGNDWISGNEFANVLDGGLGADELRGEGGNDTLHGGLGVDQLYGGAGDDVLNGGDGGDLFEGGAGADQFNGGAGVDEASYHLSSAGVEVDVLLNRGFSGDAQGDSFSSIENLIGSQFNDYLSGDDGANFVYGLDGDDRLWGNAANDILIGGVGADILTGGAGFDSTSYHTSDIPVRVVLFQFQGYSGDAAGDLFGSIEEIIGSRGDDTILGDNAGNRLFGLEGNDQIEGDTGNDELSGGGGNDRVAGQHGNDILYGDGGQDLIIGGPGSDAFVYRSTSDSTAAAPDTILDFGAGDVINLSLIDANTNLGGDQGFSFIANAAFSNTAGELRYDAGVLSADTNGDGVADFVVSLTGVASLQGSDFLL